MSALIAVSFPYLSRNRFRILCASRCQDGFRCITTRSAVFVLMIDSSPDRSVAGGCPELLLETEIENRGISVSNSAECVRTASSIPRDHRDPECELAWSEP